MKTVKQEEPIARSRFIACPSCKTRTLKLKKVVQSGRCRGCHESYKIVMVFVRTGVKVELASQTNVVKTETQTGSLAPSWETPSDTSLFGTSAETGESTFSSTSFGWSSSNKENEPGTTNQQ